MEHHSQDQLEQRNRRDRHPRTSTLPSGRALLSGRTRPTGRPPSLTGRRAHTVPVAAQVQAHRRDVVTWALAHNHPVDRDALAAIVGHGPRGLVPSPTVTPPGTGEPLPTGGWTTEWIDDLLWTGFTRWCRTRGARFPHPERVLSTLTTYIAYLSANRMLGPGSDGPTPLRRAVARHRQERERQERNRREHDRSGREVPADAARRTSATTSSCRPLASVTPITTPIV